MEGGNIPLDITRLEGVTALRVQEDIDPSYLLYFLDPSCPQYTLTLSPDSSSCILAKNYGDKDLITWHDHESQAFPRTFLHFTGREFTIFILEGKGLQLGSDLLSSWSIAFIVVFWCHPGSIIFVPSPPPMPKYNYHMMTLGRDPCSIIILT